MLLQIRVCFMVCFLGVFIHCKTSFDCNQSSYSACKDHDGAKSFPETEKELEISCINAIDKMQCSVDYEEKCKKQELPPDSGLRLLGYLKEICSKSHPIYSVLVNNLKCVKSVMDDDADVCHKYFPSEETFRNYSKALLDRGINAFSGDENNAIECLMRLSSTACLAQEMEKCGKTAVDAFITFSQEVTSILLEDCGDKFSKYLPEIISVMNGKEI